jgi:hypothetical protein
VSSRSSKANWISATLRLVPQYMLDHDALASGSVARIMGSWAIGPFRSDDRFGPRMRRTGERSMALIAIQTHSASSFLIGQLESCFQELRRLIFSAGFGFQTLSFSLFASFVEDHEAQLALILCRLALKKRPFPSGRRQCARC